MSTTQAKLEFLECEISEMIGNKSLIIYEWMSEYFFDICEIYVKYVFSNSIICNPKCLRYALVVYKPSVCEVTPGFVYFLKINHLI